MGKYYWLWYGFWRKLTGVTLTGVTLSIVKAQASPFTDPFDGRFDMSKYLSENAYGFLPVPMVITDPAVEGGLGMIGLFFHEDEKAQQQRLQAMSEASSNAGRYLLPPNVSALAIAGTGNDSWFVGGGHMGFFRHGDLRYSGGGGYGDINIDFYGLVDYPLRQPVEINTQATALLQTLKMRLAKSNWFLGVSQRYIDAELSVQSLGSLEGTLPPDAEQSLLELFQSEVTTSGLGVVLEYDSRDNIFTPQQGFQYQFNAMLFDDAFGSDIDYHLLRLQGLNYWSLTDKWRMGLKLAGEYADSDNILPPYATPAIQLRGIPAMRYQGPFVAMTETELVWEIDSRWRALFFGGFGKAAEKPSGFSDADSIDSVGVGFRYQVARLFGLDMGVDIARGPEETVFYITAGSAWSGM